MNVKKFCYVCKIVYFCSLFPKRKIKQYLLSSIKCVYLFYNIHSYQNYVYTILPTRKIYSSKEVPKF